MKTYFKPGFFGRIGYAIFMLGDFAGVVEEIH
jgi:hypothetical protein